MNEWKCKKAHLPEIKHIYLATEVENSMWKLCCSEAMPNDNTPKGFYCKRRALLFRPNGE